MVTRMTKTNNNEMCIEIYSQSSFHSFTLTHALLANKNNTHKVLEQNAEKRSKRETTIAPIDVALGIQKPSTETASTKTNKQKEKIAAMSKKNTTPYAAYKCSAYHVP